METRQRILVEKRIKSACALCSEIFVNEGLCTKELKNIQSVLVSLVPDVAGILDETSDHSKVFCGPCGDLLKEAVRLHCLLESLNSQLNSIVLSIKEKVVGMSLEIKIEDEHEVKEERETDEESLPSDCEPLGIHDNISSAIETLARGIISSRPSLNSQRKPKIVRSHKRKQKDPTELKDINKSKKSKPNRSFLCSLCSLNFNNKRDKVVHFENLHFKGASEDVEGECQLYSRICGKSSRTPADISQHNEKCHKDSFKLVCLRCTPQRKFTSQDLLEAHQPIHDSFMTSFPCSLCLTNPPVTFDTPVLLDNHILRVHTHSIKPPVEYLPHQATPECKNHGGSGGLKKKACRWCEYRPNKGLFCLRTHERKTHPEHFGLICPHKDCQSTFAEESHRLTCQETHRDSPPPFNCFVCNLTCDTGLDLKEHLASKHTAGGIKCKECPDTPVSCTKRYSSVEGLRLHKARYHGGERPFKCPVCQKGFDFQSNVNDHLRSIHKDDQLASVTKSLDCSDCGKQFKSRSGLSGHRRQCHKGLDIFTCEECGKVLRKKSSMDLHMKSHKGIKDNVCHFCGKAFVNPKVLTVHLRVHTGEKPFVCHICSKAFAQTTPMYKHFALHKNDGTWVEKPNGT